MSRHVSDKLLRSCVLPSSCSSTVFYHSSFPSFSFFLLSLFVSFLLSQPTIHWTCTSVLRIPAAIPLPSYRTVLIVIDFYIHASRESRDQVYAIMITTNCLCRSQNTKENSCLLDFWLQFCSDRRLDSLRADCKKTAQISTRLF